MIRGVGSSERFVRVHFFVFMQDENALEFLVLSGLLPPRRDLLTPHLDL